MGVIAKWPAAAWCIECGLKLENWNPPLDQQCVNVLSAPIFKSLNQLCWVWIPLGPLKMPKLKEPQAPGCTTKSRSGTAGYGTKDGKKNGLWTTRKLAEERDNYFVFNPKNPKIKNLFILEFVMFLYRIWIWKRVARIWQLRWFNYGFWYAALRLQFLLRVRFVKILDTKCVWGNCFDCSLRHQAHPENLLHLSWPKRFRSNNRVVVQNTCIFTDRNKSSLSVRTATFDIGRHLQCLCFPW